MTIIARNAAELQRAAMQKFQDIVAKEGLRFKEILREELLKYYNSYEPSIYNRSWRLFHSIRISPVQIRDNSVAVCIYFDQNLSYGLSLFGGIPGFKPILINYGWRWRKKTGPYRLGYYQGFGFVESAIDRWNRDNKHNLRIESIATYGGRIVAQQQIN